MTLLSILDVVRDALAEMSDETDASKLQRLAASAFDFDMKFYMGGKYELVNMDALLTGQRFDATAETALDGAISWDDTTITVDSTTGFEYGAFVIVKSGDAEEYEFVGYTSKDATNFYGCTRGPLTGRGERYWYSEHPDNAQVLEWLPVTDYIQSVDVAYDLNDSVATWNATLQGFNYNSRLFDNDMSMIAFVRFRPKDGDIDIWTDWVIWFVGYIKDCNIADDHTEKKEWSGTCAPLSQYVDTTDVQALRFGKVNLAEDKTCQVSSYLEDPFLEANTGEYIGYPDLSCSNAVDENILTLWMSQGLPAPTVPGMNPDHWSINEVYLRPSHGYDSEEYQWIEIAYKGIGSGRIMLGDCKLSNKNTTWRGGEGNRTPLNNYLWFRRLGNMQMDDDGSFAVVCKNLSQFKEKFGGGGAAYLIDWDKIAIGHWALDPRGDFLCLTGGGSGPGFILSVVWWRSGEIPFSLHNFQGEGGGDPNPGRNQSCWTGPMIPSGTLQLPPGTSFRRDPDNNNPLHPGPDSQANWRFPEYDPTPGSRTYQTAEYLSVDLGALGIKLDGELGSGETSEIALDGTLGLRESGVVKINAEIIRYESRDDADDKLLTLTRGIMGTTTATHPDESFVLQWENGDVFDCPLVGGITVRRRRVLATNAAPIVIRDFEVYGSTYVTPGVYPDDHQWNNGYLNGGWPDYWTHLYSQSNNMGTSINITFNPRRIRHVMIVVYRMSDNKRAKVNEFKVWAHTMLRSGGDDSGTWDGEWSGDIIKYLLVTEFGLDPDNFLMHDRGRPFEDLPTTKGQAGQVIRDLLRRTGCMLRYRMDQKIEHRFDPFYPMAALPDIEVEWDRTYARSVRLTQPFRHNVNQVVVNASNTMTDESFEGRYPPVALALGSEQRLEDLVISDEEDAHLIAMMRFGQANAPLQASIVPIGPAEWLMPGDRTTIDWDLDEDGVFINDLNFVITQLHWRVAFGDKEDRPTWAASVALKEVRF